MPQPPWKPLDWIVMGIAFTLCLILIAGIINIYLHPESFDSDRGERFKAGYMALLSILTLWVGSKIKTTKDE